MEIELGKKAKEYKVLKDSDTITKELQQFILDNANRHCHFLKKRHTLKVEKVPERKNAWNVLFQPVNHHIISYVIAMIVYRENIGWFIYRPAFQYKLGANLAKKYYDIIYKYFNAISGLPNPYQMLKKKGVSLWK